MIRDRSHCRSTKRVFRSPKRSLELINCLFQKASQYTLTLQAADRLGTGLRTTATAIISLSTAGPAPAPSLLAAHPDAGNHTLLTVHALNVLTGLPATGLALHLSRPGDPQRLWEEMFKSATNSDGRLDGGSQATRQLTAGTYKLRFETGAYWEQQGYRSFYPYVEVVFSITEAERKVHIPLLLSPYSYSTYRGS
uniref:hydroxyisourate hydrolase n=1 Tax=Salvator merianae TaxID=96440 RepID=A0A8D0BI62_SALMN